MKKYIVVLVILSLAFFGCTAKVHTKEPEIEKPVKVSEIVSEEDDSIIEYYGIVSSQDITKLGFKSTSRLESINVKVGQKISKGDVLANLDKEDLNISLKAAEAKANAAKALYQKAVNGATDEEKAQIDSKLNQAVDTLAYTEDNFNKIKKLYEQGSVSKNDFDKAKLEYDVRKSDLTLAKEARANLYNGAREEDELALKEQANQAMADYEYKKSLVEDATMVSEIDGSVVDIMYEVGELVPAGYPVIIVKGNTKIVESGVVSSDVKKINVNDICYVVDGSNRIESRVLTVASVPSVESRVFKIEVIPSDEDVLTLGDIVDVEYVVGKEKAIWIPLSSIMSTEIDYVFKVVDGKVDKVKIEIEATKDTYAKVSGLTVGDKIVVEGMKNLRLGDKVKVVK